MAKAARHVVLIGVMGRSSLVTDHPPECARRYGSAAERGLSSGVPHRPGWSHSFGVAQPMRMPARVRERRNRPVNRAAGLARRTVIGDQHREWPRGGLARSWDSWPCGGPRRCGFAGLMPFLAGADDQRPALGGGVFHDAVRFPFDCRDFLFQCCRGGRVDGLLHG